MRVAFALTQSLDSPSGLGRYGPIAREMARRGHAVEIYALHPDWQGLKSRATNDDGVSVSYVGPMHVRKEGARKLYYGPAQLLMVTFQATLQMAYALRRSRAEVIHLGKPQPVNALAARLARRGRPIYCDCDDYEAGTNRFSGEWQRRIVRYFEDGVTDYAARLTTNTRYTQQRYEALGFPRERIMYAPNGVDRQRFDAVPQPRSLRNALGIPDGAPVILYLGTMSTLSHGVDLLISAFAIALRAVPDARLLLVGGGEDYDGLRSQARELGLSERAIFTGRVAPERAPLYYRTADLSVDPVRDDPVARARAPLKVVESLVMGTPVVTSPVGDRAAALREGEMGALVASGSEAALADGIITLLGDPARRAAMSQAALADRERWFWDHLVEDFLRVYDVG